MRIPLFLLIFAPNMHAMQNQVNPISSAPAPMTEQELCNKVLQDLEQQGATIVHQDLVPFIANAVKQKTASGDIESGSGASILLQAANDALTAKSQTTVSKTTSGYITAGVSIAATVITALAASYGTSNTKC